MRRPSSTITCSPIRISKRRGLATQTLGNQLQGHFVTADEEGVRVEERGQDLGLVHTERAQNDRHRQLAAPVDTRKHTILRIELEIEPRATIRNDARRKDSSLPDECVLPTVVIEEHARLRCSWKR